MYCASYFLLFRRLKFSLLDLKLSFRDSDVPRGAISTSTKIYSYYHDAVKPKTLRIRRSSAREINPAIYVSAKPDIDRSFHTYGSFAPGAGPSIKI
jgi:hypothetical protein